MDLRDTRIRRLALFAERHDATDNPSKLGLLIGKKPNQVYNLLNRKSSFGEKVARSIEEAAGLPRYWLDTDSEDAALPAEVAELAAAVGRLPPKQREAVMNVARAALKMALESITASSEGMTAPTSVASHNTLSRKKSG